MSCTKRGNSLPHALRLAYAGPAAERLAADLDISLRSARSALHGQYPRAWEKFVRLIEKTPAVLAHCLETDWASNLQLLREMSDVRSRIQSMEARLNAANQKSGGVVPSDDGASAAVGGGANRPLKSK